MRKYICGIAQDMAVPVRGQDNAERYYINIDSSRCTGCGSCLAICPTGAIRGSIGFPHDIPHVEACLHCGMCLKHCPERAIYETFSWLDEVETKLASPDVISIAMPAPAVRHTLKQFFPHARMDTAKLRGALDAIGFKHCWDVQFGADVTIQEEGTEFLERMNSGAKLPMLSSCCPAWVRFVEIFYPELLPNVSSVKSPVAINGRIAKTYAAVKMDYDPAQLYNVILVPCIAKKYEALTLPGYGGNPDIDAVLTTRELAHLLRNLDMKLLPSRPEDELMGASSWSGAKFCIGGGVMEAMIRYISFSLTGSVVHADLGRKREGSGIRTMDVTIGGNKLKFACVCGAAHFPHICEEIIRNKSPFDFIEFMACPGGCIGGGGQPPDIHLMV